jgi:hypothetical protein
MGKAAPFIMLFGGAFLLVCIMAGLSAAPGILTAQANSWQLSEAKIIQPSVADNFVKLSEGNLNNATASKLQTEGTSTILGTITFVIVFLFVCLVTSAFLFKTPN